MKILMLANNDVGLYKFRKELIQELLCPGLYIKGRNTEPCKVFVSIPEGEFTEEIEGLGCEVINTFVDRRGMNPFKDLKLLNKYRLIMKKVKPDIVLTYTIKPNIYGGIICSLVKTPYIPNITGLGTSIKNNSFMSKLILLMYKVGIKSAKTIFFQNASNQDFFVTKKIIRDAGIHIRGSGVNLKEHCFENYPQNDGKLKFLFIGRIMRDKGIHEFLDCAEYIKGKYTDIEFNVLGAYDEEEFKFRIEQLSEEGVIHYYGQQKDVHSFIKIHHATILPSYHEGLSNVLLETAASGRPVIASNISGCIETYDDGVSGIGFEPRNSKALIKALEKFISLPYAEKMKMGIAARRKVEKEFNREIIIESYLKEIYK